MTQKIDKLGVIFESIKIKNFQSFGNLWTEFALNTPGTTLLIGENLDNGGSSGAGKSTLINAISFALYDKIPTGVSKDRMINQTNDKKNTLMEVQLNFTSSGEKYVLRRWRGSSTGVQLLKVEGDESKDITPASVNRGEDSFNAKIEELIGFSYNLFSQIILFNGNSRPFLDLPVSNQRELIEELFKITLLTRKANALKKMASETEKSIDLQKAIIIQQQKQVESKNKHILEAKERVNKWNLAHEQNLQKLQKQFEDSLTIDFDTEEKIHLELVGLNQSLFDAQNSVKNLSLQKTSRERESAPFTAQLTISKSDLSKKKTEISKLISELQHLRDAKCPYCLQSFEDAASKISEKEANQSSLQCDIDELTIKCDQLQIDCDEWNKQKDADVLAISHQLSKAKEQEAEIKEQYNVIASSLNFHDINALHAAKASLVSLQEKLEAALEEKNPHVEAYESLLAEEEIVVNDKELNELQSLYDHQKFLVKLLVDKNSFIRKNIISKTIPFLNKRIAYYTEKLNLPHVVLFQSDMSCEISQIGRILDHGNLSNGEKKKLNLSLCLAFRDVLSYLHDKVNVLFTDEIDGGSISGPDVDSLVSMIKSKAWDDDISIFVISHRPEFDGRCDKFMVVRKENGFSTLIEQPD
jgi:DNA repair exonuclease SbcCD ATPase subunit